jgi:hypothetical protein
VILTLTGGQIEVWSSYHLIGVCEHRQTAAQTAAAR